MKMFRVYEKITSISEHIQFINAENVADALEIQKDTKIPSSLEDKTTISTSYYIEEVKDNNNNYLCEDCKKTHDELAFCQECRSCLYKHSFQVQDLNYPLFECKNCHTINFWD